MLGKSESLIRWLGWGSILSSPILDAIRDAWIDREAGINWWPWHIVKWLSYYPALTYVLIKLLEDIDDSFRERLFFVVIIYGVVAWTITYTVFHRFAGTELWLP